MLDFFLSILALIYIVVAVIYLSKSMNHIIVSMDSLAHCADDHCIVFSSIVGCQGHC